MRCFAIFSLLSLFAAPSALAYSSEYAYSRDISPQDLGTLEARAVVDALYDIAERRLVDELVRRGPKSSDSLSVNLDFPKFASMTYQGQTRIPPIPKPPPQKKHPLPVIPEWVPGMPVLPSPADVQLGMRPKGQAPPRRKTKRDLEEIEAYSF